MHRYLFTLALATGALGCSFNEDLEILDLKGKVVLPEEAATRVLPDGSTIENDPRLIGPVYLGLYPDVIQGPSYPIPDLGPDGAAHPYGGTTVGDLKFACIQDLQCRVATGRFMDFDALVTWFNDDLDYQLNDAYGDEINSGEYLRDICYELFRYTTDEEVGVTVTKDRNEDEKVDELDLDFVQRNDGKWEADFTVIQADFFPGFSVWGWMDAPAYGGYLYSTCDPEAGYNVNEYNLDYYGGRPFLDLLNVPWAYISLGDFVPSADPESDSYTWDNPEDVVEIELDSLYGEL